MALSEFGLIERFFSQKKTINASTRLGIGDDCALVAVPEGCELAVTTDTMVEKVHFFPDVDPESLGHKLLAVNLSDLASMGALPVAVTLAITLPEVDEPWLQAFSRGFLALAEQYSVDLIGGDTSSGALTLTVQALGLVPSGKALRRSTAIPGDMICMTGSLGEAGLGLKIIQGYRCVRPEVPLQRFHRPLPRVESGLKLLDIASSCIDLSDGLLADLGHILDQSGVGASVEWERLPIAETVNDYIQETGDWQMPVSAGEDYELCFTVSPGQLNQLDVDYRQIGIIEAESGLRFSRSGKLQPIKVKGFEHFS